MKEEFIQLLKSTNRTGVDSLLKYLEESDFYTAPASSIHHMNIESGLLQHSLNVCKVALKTRTLMLDLYPQLSELLPQDSVIIAALLHDICKTNIYTLNSRYQYNKKYTVDYSKFPLGHGEKSVIILLRNGLELTDDEIIAIRWHMTAWEIPFQSIEAKNNFNTAKKLSPLLTLIQTADSLASALLERNQ